MKYKQLVIKDFFKKENTKASNVESAYNAVKNCFSELYNIGIIEGYLYENITPITYDITFEHSIIYDKESKCYKYYETILSIEGVNIHLRNNKITFTVLSTDNKLTTMICNWARKNSQHISRILSTYNKYYSLFTYNSNKLPKILCQYDIEDNISIIVDNKGSVELFHNYIDVSDDKKFQSYTICSYDKEKEIIEDTTNKCKKLLLTRKDN